MSNAISIMGSTDVFERAEGLRSGASASLWLLTRHWLQLPAGVNNYQETITQVSNAELSTLNLTAEIELASLVSF